MSAPLGLDTAGLAGMVAALATLDVDVEPSERIDRMRILEELRSAVAAAQARETVAFTAERRAERRTDGAGKVSEWRATLLARETAWLPAEHRAVVDAELAPRLEQLGDRQVETEARRLGYRLDPEGYVARFRNAPKDRHVSIRPAPDAMVRLSALLPVASGVACYAALAATADTSTAGGDQRSRGQVMADTLIERLTDQASATEVPVAVNLILTDHTLLADGSEPGHLDGYGPLPAPIARDLALGESDAAPRWLRRLYTHPSSGQLIAMESKRRRFPQGMRTFIRFRDQHCRTPYCDAAIRHSDHIQRHADGGATSITGGQGDCETCNYTKETPGWQARVIDNPDGPHEVETTTPTGHRYRSRTPDPRPEPIADSQARADVVCVDDRGVAGEGDAVCPAAAGYRWQGA